MSTLLGLDLGTSSFKVSAYRDSGEHLGTVTRPTPWRSVPSGPELDPRIFADAVRTMVEQCVVTHANGGIAGIGVTGMAETAFIQTSDGVRHPARAWNGHRESTALPEPALFEVTGLLDASRTTAVELRRVTDAGGRIRDWTGVPEFAVQVLGGAAVAERSLASRSGLVDVRAGAWSTPLLEWAGVSEAEQTPLTPAGSAAGVVPTGWGAGAVLTAAGHDHVTGAVGAGAADGRTVFDSLGTGEGIVARVAADPSALSADRLRALTSAGFNVGLGVDDADVVALAGLGSGNRFNLLLSALADSGFARDDVLLAAARPPGDPESLTNGLTAEAADLVEVLGGADWQQLRGTAAVVVGRAVPDLVTARRLWWSAVARITSNARDAIGAARRLVPTATRLVAAGGWLGNPGVRAVRTTMLGEFEIPPVAQAGTRGAALLAGLAAGVYATRDGFPSLTDIPSPAGTGETA